MGYFGADVQVSTKKINNITEKVRKILKEELSEETLSLREQLRNTKYYSNYCLAKFIE
jgi:hypothetical protein